MMNLKFCKLRPGAQMPTRATAGSAGYDLYACLEEAVTIAPHRTVPVPTGIAIALPDNGCAAFLFARSGLAVKHGIAPANCVGVIDSDYRGEIIAGLTNHTDTPYTLQPGERIAQLVFLPVVLPEWQEADALDDTARGAGGFGSTGKE